MENIFRHANLADQTFIKEIHPIRYRAGKDKSKRQIPIPVWIGLKPDGIAQR
jgi:hypothetical protein